MRAVFATLIGKDRLNQSVPLTIFAFNNDKSYYQAVPSVTAASPCTAAGFFLSGDDQDFIALNLSADEPWRAVAHEFATMLLTYNYPPAQGWFDEGLAEYFSSIRLDNKQVELGADPELRASTTQNISATSATTHPPKSLTDLLDAQVWLSAARPVHHEARHPRPATKARTTRSTTPNRGSSCTICFTSRSCRKLERTSAWS